MTAKNPFKQATSVNEFFELLRADLERLRCQKFRLWETGDVRIQGEWLNFYLDADETAIVGASPCSWYEIAESRYYHEAVPVSQLLRKHSGYGCFIVHSTHPGRRKNSLNVRAQVTLRHMPKILKLLERNGKLITDSDRAVREDPEHRRLKLVADQAFLEMSARSGAIRAEYDKKHPQIDPMTGSPVVTRKNR